MAWLWQILLIVMLLNMSIRTWGKCLDKGRYNSGNHYLCSNMTREQCKTDMEGIMNLETIRRLELSQISLPIIDQHLFTDKYTQIFHLTIRQCDVTAIEDHSLDIFTQLDYLYILDNNIKIINGQVLKYLSDLDELNLSNNGIQQFNIDCNHHPQFTNLILNNNSLITLQNNTFQNCEYLKKVQIRHSKVKEILKDAFLDLNNLWRLDLSHNPITIIEPGAFSGIQNNSVIHLSYIFRNTTTNYLKNSLFSELEYYIHLTLHNIETIEPAAFKGFHLLLSLNLQSNRISTFPCDIFDTTNVIDELNLSHNQIENISTCAFQNLESLNHLHLQYNQISYLKMRTFSALGQLRYLDLSHNKLSALDEAVLHPLDNIVTLDISTNRFMYFNPAQVLSHLKTLRQIDLSGNQWSCQNLTLIRKYLRSHRITYNSKIKNFNVENIGGIQCTNDQISNLIDNNTESQTSYESHKNIEAILRDIKNYTRITNKILNNLCNNCNRNKEFALIGNDYDDTHNSMYKLETNPNKDIFNLILIVVIGFICY